MAIKKKKFNNVDASKLIEAEFNNQAYSRFAIQFHNSHNSVEFEHVVIMTNIELNGHLRIRVYDSKHLSNDGDCVIFNTWANREIRVPRISASAVTLVRYE